MKSSPRALHFPARFVEMTNMKKLALLAVLASSTTLTGCAGLAFSTHSVNTGFYAETKANERVTDNAVGTKTGEACSQSYLGVVTTGDSSVPAAAKAGGIRKIASVDNKFTNMLGLYATYCVVVTGD
jgi:hypothetical protein